MPMNRLKLLRVRIVPALLAAAFGGMPAFAEEPAKPGDASGKTGEVKVDGQNDPTKVLKLEPGKPRAIVAPAAQQTLDAVRDAYKALKSASMSGKLTADFDIDGQKVNNAAEFTASFEAPNKFRHEVKDDVQVGSTGEKFYAFRPSANLYLTADAPKDRVAGAKDLPSPMGQILDQQNPSLLLALVADASAQLLDGVTKADRAAEAKIGGVAYVAVTLTTRENAEVQVLFDPNTNLVRRISADMRKAAEARGQQDVKQAQLVIDYTDVKANVPAAAAEQFAWAPPEGAKDASALAADAPADPSALEGTAASDFALKGLDDKEVKLAALKGSVVVLDFWATWCGPCRASLPHLDALNKEMAPKGVKVFAVNQQEEAADVKKFIEETKLTTAVLLDSTGSAGRSFAVSGIPQTVVIGKDGKIRKVFVGFDPAQSPKMLKDAVEAALK
jgi:cytochrome c biogenesis protein CcmG/thiol:disulfide interchange protein DsbE